MTLHPLSRGKATVALLVIGLQILSVFAQTTLVFAAEQKREPMTFRPSDAVRIRILQIGQGNDRGTNIESLVNGDYPIDSRGEVELPILGRVQVTGHTKGSLAELLKEKYSPYLTGEAVITVKPLIRVTMQGAFNRPGSYRVEPDISLWELVNIAGGPTPNCEIRKIWVERGGKVVKKNLLTGFERGYSLEEVGIQSGDQILAPERNRFSLRRVLDGAFFVLSAAFLYVQIRERVK